MGLRDMQEDEKEKVGLNKFDTEWMYDISVVIFQNIWSMHYIQYNVTVFNEVRQQDSLLRLYM